MANLTFIDKKNFKIEIPGELLKGKRHLTQDEIKILEENFNICEEPSWSTVYVDNDENGFDPSLIKNSRFSGFVILGRICPAYLKYHDLELPTGIIDSNLHNVITGNDNVIHKVTHLENYRLGDRVMLFNVQEMSCTNHSKFGNGILKNGEDEKKRIWIEIANENGGRSVLPYDNLIPADAYIWSKYRDDEILMKSLVSLTEKEFSKELDTYGTIGDDSIIKNSLVIKDAKIGNCCYIKGAFKIKNVTIFSSEDEVTQIGEGVELVNGIVHEGSRIFYQAVAVRFIVGKNCQLKYGARLLNSILGDNSTVSCCELLNNLIYPFHEQHHNSSFLIATTIMGQSNIAAGATIGSNHNSRSPDGEIIANRGFWPGLCTDFKHNSRFASFVLANKGSYHHELNIIYPFSLIAPPKGTQDPIEIIPAFWFLYNAFAIVRNKYKFKERDKRLTKLQIIETDPLSPDTIQEIIAAKDHLYHLAEQKLSAEGKDPLLAENLLVSNAENKSFTLFDSVAQRKYGAVIQKAGKGYIMYNKILKYFAVRSIMQYLKTNGISTITNEIISTKLLKIEIFKKWINLGGQVIPEECVKEIISKIKNGKLDSWDKIHAKYEEFNLQYVNYKAAYALDILKDIYKKSVYEISKEELRTLISDVKDFSNYLYNASFDNRKKDYTDPFRKMTYDSDEEMENVLGKIEDNSFLKTLKKDTDTFNEDLDTYSEGILN